MIWATAVSSPVLVTWTRMAPSMFTVPPMTLLPTFFETGFDSPVIIASLREGPPSVTIPSLIVATYGGGTGLPTQRECLEVLGAYGAGRVHKFAEIVAATVLALGVLWVALGAEPLSVLARRVRDAVARVDAAAMARADRSPSGATSRKRA